MSKFYEFKMKDNKGNDFDFANLKGKVVLIVNSATSWGLTPQLKDLSALYDECEEKGFVLIDVPCNQFGAQAQGSDAEIDHFCSSNFGTKFPRMTKSDVNGENELPLYTWLKSQKGFQGFGDSPMGQKFAERFSKQDPNYDKSPDLKWNFTKFVIDKGGNVVARFEPPVEFSKVADCVKNLL